jgi:hypothetical protein
VHEGRRMGGLGAEEGAKKGLRRRGGRAAHQ